MRKVLSLILVLIITGIIPALLAALVIKYDLLAIAIGIITTIMITKELVKE